MLCSQLSHWELVLSLDRHCYLLEFVLCVYCTMYIQVPINASKSRKLVLFSMQRLTA